MGQPQQWSVETEILAYLNSTGFSTGRFKKGIMHRLIRADHNIPAETFIK